MIPFVVPASQARRHLGELLDQAFRRGSPFLLTQTQKPMEVLLGTPQSAQTMKLVEKHDPGLADTLAILADPELPKAIEQGTEDAKTGRTVPIGELLKDYPMARIVELTSKA